MKKLGDNTLNTIERLIVQPTPHKKQQPTTAKSKSKSRSPYRPTKSPTRPHQQSHQQHTGHSCEPSTYLGQKQLKHIARQRKLAYQIEGMRKFRVENPVSFYYNQKNPKAPLYERAHQISVQKEAVLEEKREEMRRNKQREKQLEEEKFRIEQSKKKKISKNKALALTDRLYRDHFDKTTRLNQQKIEWSKNEARGFRNAPLINDVSRDIFHMVSRKNEWEDTVLDRFNRYEVDRARVKKEREEAHQNKYYPFHPTINQTSRAISQHRENQSDTHFQHSRSCTRINHSRSQTNHHSPQKKYHRHPTEYSAFTFVEQ